MKHKINSALFLFSSFALFGCSSTEDKEWVEAAQERTVASVELTHDQKHSILIGIPLVKGIEKSVESENTIAHKLADVFKAIAQENKNKDQSLNRGTHARGSCFNGEIKVFSPTELKGFSYKDETIKTLRQGAFAFEGTYPVQVRFANAKGETNADTVKDVRGFSFSMATDKSLVDYTGGNRLDFMMNTSPMFAVDNIMEFYHLMKAARKEIPNPLYLPAILKAANLLKEYERDDIKSYASEMYWANLPYLHGRNADDTARSLVKYRAIPCDEKGIQREASVGKEADYLQKDIREKVGNDEVCFLLQAQIFDNQKLNKVSGWSKRNWKPMDWVENGGAEWDEKALPFYTIAKIDVPSYLNNSNADSEQLCKNMSLNTRLYSNRENQPVGSLARVRTIVEENSRALRMGEIK